MQIGTYSFLFRHSRKIGFLAFVFIVVCLLLATFVGWSAFSAWRTHSVIFPQEMAALGQQGDFFGGHIASLVGSLTLALAILLGYFQTVETTRANLRSHFVEGMNLIFAAMPPLESPNPTQSSVTQQFLKRLPRTPHGSMKILDYYARLALQLDDEEFYFILNTIISGDIKKAVRREIAQKSENYVYAQKIWQRIGELRMNTEMDRKEDETQEA